MYDGHLFHSAAGGIDIFALSRQKGVEIKIEEKGDAVTTPCTSGKSSLILQQQDSKSMQDDLACTTEDSGINSNQKGHDSIRIIQTKSDKIAQMASMAEGSISNKVAEVKEAINREKVIMNKVKSQKVESCMDAIKRAFERGINDPRVTLPIDEHKHEILARIQRDRVTIIHGETGCGKSTRVPVMLLEDADLKGLPCRMMVSDASYLTNTIYKRVYRFFL